MCRHVLCTLCFVQVLYLTSTVAVCTSMSSIFDRDHWIGGCASYHHASCPVDGSRPSAHHGVLFFRYLGKVGTYLYCTSRILPLADAPAANNGRQATAASPPVVISYLRYPHSVRAHPMSHVTNHDSITAPTLSNHTWSSSSHSELCPKNLHALAVTKMMWHCIVGHDNDDWPRASLDDWMDRTTPRFESGSFVSLWPKSMLLSPP